MPAQGFLVRRVTQEPAPCKRMCSGVAFLGVRRRGCSRIRSPGNSLRLLQGSARAASSLTSGLAVVPGEVGVDAVVSGRGCPMWWRAAPPDTNHARARPAGPQVWSRGGGCPGCGARYASRGCPCSPSHGIRNHPRLGTRMKHPMRCGGRRLAAPRLPRQESGFLCRSTLLGVHHHDRAPRVGQHGLTDRAQQHAGETAAAPGPHHH